MPALWNFLSCITIDDTFMGLFWQDIGAQRWQGGHADGYSYGQYVVSTRKPDGYSHSSCQKIYCMFIHLNCYTGFEKNLTQSLMLYVQCLDISSSAINAKKKILCFEELLVFLFRGVCWQHWLYIGTQSSIIFKSTFILTY